MQPIKIGVIGLGKAWERLHAPAFSQMTDKFEIAAVCDINQEKAQKAANWMGLPQEAIYTDYNKMLAEAGVEAVDIIVPITENYECARVAIMRGMHLIAEKPLTDTRESAWELIRLRKRMGVTMLVAENSRYEEENLIIKKLLEERRIGNPVYFIDNHVVQFQKDMIEDSTFAASPWRRDAEFTGGVFLDSGVHHVARHRFLFGDLQTLYAAGRPSEAEFAPYSALHGMFTFNENGNHITGHYSFFITGVETQAPHVGLRIFGTEGEIYLEDKHCGFINVSHKSGSHEVIEYTPGSGYYHELNNFYEALRHKKEITSTPEKALGDMEVIFNMLHQSTQDTSHAASASKGLNRPAHGSASYAS